jgi:hypothetical protein
MEYCRNTLLKQLQSQFKIDWHGLHGANHWARVFHHGKFIAEKRDADLLVVEMPKRLREWWFKNEQGKVCVAIKYGTRVLELAKGKHSIEVASADDLIKALELVKQAVELGELDQQLEQASGSVRKAFGK